MSITSAVLHLNRMTGMLPLRRDNSGSGRKSRFNYSRGWAAYSTLILILTLTTAFKMYTDMLPVLLGRNDGDVDTSVYADLGEVTVVSITGFTIFILCLLRSKTMATILTSLEQTPARYSFLWLDRSYRERLLEWFQVGAPTLIWVALFSHDLYDNLRRHIPMSIYIPHTAYYSINYFRVAMEAQFAMVCLKLRFRFFVVNRHMEELGDLSMVRGQRIDQDGLVMVGGLWAAKEFMAPRTLMTLANRRLKSLETLRHLHEELSETVALVAGTFSEQLLLDTASCLVSLTVNLYFSLGMLLASQTDFGFIGFLFSWVIFYSLRLFILASVATSSCREAGRTRILIQKLNQRSLDKESKEEIHYFSMQLNSRQIEFTASGFFPVDFTLIYSMVGAVTTYLVILMQFQSGVKFSEPTGGGVVDYPEITQEP